MSLAPISTAYTKTFSPPGRKVSTGEPRTGKGREAEKGGRMGPALLQCMGLSHEAEFRGRGEGELESFPGAGGIAIWGDGYCHPRFLLT